MRDRMLELKRHALARVRSVAALRMTKKTSGP
jgi:hypothetical protein